MITCDGKPVTAMQLKYVCAAALAKFDLRALGIIDSKRPAKLIQRPGNIKLSPKLLVRIATLVIFNQCLNAGGLQAGECGDGVVHGGTHFAHARLVIHSNSVPHLDTTDLSPQVVQKVDHGDTAHGFALAPDSNQERNHSDDGSCGDTNNDLLVNVGYVERHLNSSYFWFGIPIGLMIGVIAGFFLLNKYSK